jgi:hypothetical protein
LVIENATQFSPEASAPANHSRDTNTGAGQDFTGLAAAVQLRLRAAILNAKLNQNNATDAFWRDSGG